MCKSMVPHPPVTDPRSAGALHRNRSRRHQRRMRNPPSWRLLEAAGPRRTDSSTPNPDLWEVSVCRVVVNHLWSLMVLNPTQYTPTWASLWKVSASRTVVNRLWSLTVPSSQSIGSRHCERGFWHVRTHAKKSLMKTRWVGCCLDGSPRCRRLCRGVC